MKICMPVSVWKPLFLFVTVLPIEGRLMSKSTTEKFEEEGQGVCKTSGFTARRQTWSSFILEG